MDSGSSPEQFSQVKTSRYGNLKGRSRNSVHKSKGSGDWFEMEKTRPGSSFGNAWLCHAISLE